MLQALTNVFVGDSFSIHFEYYMEKEFTNHNISFIDTSFTEADEIIYWDDSCVYILESELEKQKELLTKNVNKSENVITHEDYEDELCQVLLLLFVL